MQRDYQIVDPPSKELPSKEALSSRAWAAFLAKDRSLLLPMLEPLVIYFGGMHFGDFMVAAAHRRYDFVSG